MDLSHLKECKDNYLTAMESTISELQDLYSDAYEKFMKAEINPANMYYRIINNSLIFAAEAIEKLKKMIPSDDITEFEKRAVEASECCEIAALLTKAKTK